MGPNLGYREERRRGGKGRGDREGRAREGGEVKRRGGEGRER